MSTYSHDDAPSQLTMIATLLGVALLAAFNALILEWLRTHLPPTMQSGWNAHTDLWVNVIFLAEALLLCLLTFRASGLGVGDSRKWKRHGQAALLVWIIPPLLVASMYPLLTNKPYNAFKWPLAWWLPGSIAQELLFGGFIYGRLTRLFGPAPDGPAGAFSAPVLITAFLYALHHWPHLQTNEHGMSLAFMQFKFLYAFLGMAWVLNIRRWTGTVWPGVANHVLVNYLATVI